VICTFGVVVVSVAPMLVAAMLPSLRTTTSSALHSFGSMSRCRS
jgi:hypothetical protein